MLYILQANIILFKSLILTNPVLNKILGQNSVPKQDGSQSSLRIVDKVPLKE